ncbi:MAG: UTP--glucose-1-phosphate uridylyltransferase [Candidatus Thermoplasmatota archaeon]|nr:UTP--glucose-1-phosphate uridylyltransferase [Candidatus Thermoplasmatota archaeon]MCL5963864.1 UTP--glucose-1-phosphate uridylyltransferase [Candidatus Thermoplasmatota archaeon]
MKVRKAVIPAAGLGTRFYPLTKEQPKEMLPVVDKPTIHYVVEEAVNSGIEDILIILGRNKDVIVDYFDKSLRYNNGGVDIWNKCNIYYVRQKEQIGLADAIRYARAHVNDEPFAVLLGDTINIAEIPVTRQLMNMYEKLQKPVIAIETVTPKKAKDYGIVAGDMIDEKLMRINEMLEKPENPPTLYGISGNYILDKEIFENIDKIHFGKNKELQLTDAIELYMEKYGYLFDGKRYDIGDLYTWMKANFELTLKDSRFLGLREELL